jgi:methionyl-tRNA formyltransferase
MRAVFMGTPEFSVPILDRLHESHEVLAVYTRPDSVSGRGRELRPTPVKAHAERLGIPVLTPGHLSDPGTVDELASLDPDIIVVASYSLLLTEPVLEIPRYGCLNVHPSLLPRWRGAAPIQRAILSDDGTTGVCIMRMETGLDTGDYAACATYPLEDRYLDEVVRDLSHIGAEMLLEVIDHCADGSLVWTRQDDGQMTYAEKLDKSELRLDPDDGAHADALKVRASNRSTPAKVLICGKPATIVHAHDLEVGLPAGRVEIGSDGLFLGYGDSTLCVETLKPDGGKEMDALAWARGLRNDQFTWGRLS